MERPTLPLAIPVDYRLLLVPSAAESLASARKLLLEGVGSRCGGQERAELPERFQRPAEYFDRAVYGKSNARCHQLYATTSSDIGMRPPDARITPRRFYPRRTTVLGEVYRMIKYRKSCRFNS